jgi:hypothetical protein
MLRKVALIFGIVFILVGILGFVTPGGMSMEADPAPGHILGLFGVNLLHNVVHLLIGVWGIVASRTWGGAKTYMQIGGVLYIVLAALGFVIPSTFGLIPIGGNDIYLHAVLGLIMAGIGFTAKPEAAPTTA